MDQRPDRSRRTRVVAAVTIVVLAAGSAVALTACAHDHRDPAVGLAPRPGPGPSRHVGADGRADAEEFVAALRAGDRSAALAHGTAAVYDRLVREEAGATGRARLQRCVRSAGGSAWSCGLDFPSTGPADGEAYALTMTRSGAGWRATAAAVVAG
jgi:hypothetical protein